MITIHKYPLYDLGTLQLMLPAGAQLLSVDEQNNVPVLYAQVDTTAMLELREVLLLETGHPIPDGSFRFIGTVLTRPQDGRYPSIYAFHVFEVTTPRVGAGLDAAERVGGADAAAADTIPAPTTGRRVKATAAV